MSKRAEPVGPSKQSSEPDPYAHAEWIRTINRLLGAEMRPDPRPKPGHPARLKYWNQTDLSEATGLRGNTLSDIMKGKREPSIDSLGKIATALGQPMFIFLMDPVEAERYSMFREAKTAEDQIRASRANTELIVKDILMGLAPQLADIVEERQRSHAEPIPNHPQKHVRKRTA